MTSSVLTPSSFHFVTIANDSSKSNPRPRSDAPYWVIVPASWSIGTPDSCHALKSLSWVAV